MENVLEKKEKAWRVEKEKHLSGINYQYDQAKKFLGDFERALKEGKIEAIPACMDETIGHLNKIKGYSEEILDGEKKIKMEKEDDESEQDWKQKHQASRNLIRKVLKTL